MTIIIVAEIVAVGLGLAAIVAVALASASASGGSSRWEIGSPFAIGSLPARPRGVQEDDLPPFVFRDRPAPVHAPSSAAPRFGQLSLIGS